jgi:lipoprotein NlpD
VGKESYSDQTLARALAQVQRKTPAAKPESCACGRRQGGGCDADSASSNWIWPASGKVVGTFSEGGAKGIDIAGKAGDPVLAVSDGKVVYSGTGLRGYGKLVIVKHSSTYLTAYAHNQKILVKEGQSVVKGQKIAEMGNTDADQVKLHFEVRKQGRPVDPLKHLPRADRHVRTLRFRCRL